MTFTIRVPQSAKNSPWKSTINRPQFQEDESLPIRVYEENGYLVAVYSPGYAIGVYRRNDELEIVG